MRNEELIELGAVCGRFQIFHNDHLKYVLAAKKRCKHLMIGITSADPSVSPAEKTDKNRNKRSANPCTYYERMIIIEKALHDLGWTNEEFHIIPFPIGKPMLLKYYLPQDAVCFFTIYDEWGMEKLERLRNEGYGIEVLWKKNKKSLSSTYIRSLMAEGHDWKSFVPKATYQYITEHHIDERIIGMMKMGD